MNEFPKVGEEGHHLYGSTGFTGEDEQASPRVNFPRDLLDPAWNGGIKDPQTWVPA